MQRVVIKAVPLALRSLPPKHRGRVAFGRGFQRRNREDMLLLGSWLLARKCYFWACGWRGGSTPNGESNVLLGACHCVISG